MVWTLQEGIRSCQKDMLQNSPDHVLHPAMIEECNKLAPLYAPKSDGSEKETPSSVPKAKVTPDSIEFQK
jgi:hypothetical protein